MRSLSGLRHDAPFEGPRRGFHQTLELLIVVAMMAVITGFVLPCFIRGTRPYASRNHLSDWATVGLIALEVVALFVVIFLGILVAQCVAWFRNGRSKNPQDDDS